MPLPHFSFLAQVTAETAKQDHLHITVGEWVIEGSTDEVDNLRHYMAVPPIGERGSYEFSQVYGMLFKRPHQSGPWRPPLEIRSKVVVGSIQHHPPLFQGVWNFNNYVRRDLTERGRTGSRLVLNLNPTRFVRYQSPHAFPAISAPRFFAPRSSGGANGEMALDGKDNWLSDSQRMAAFTNATRWPVHLRNYLNGVPRLFDDTLRRVSSTYDLPIHCAPTFNLHSAETYWEFLSENPTAVVESLKPLVQSFTSRASSATPFELPPHSGLDGNSLSIRAEIRKGLWVRIYAKTNRRIRFEICHTLGVGGFSLRGGHVGDHWEEIPVLLERLAENAAIEVNRLFSHFSEQSEAPVSHITAYHLLLKIASSSEAMDVALTICSALVHTSRISARGNPERLQTALTKLKQEGVLVLNVQRKTYTVAAPYRHALDMLTQHGNYSLLAPDRHRRVR